jgi:hypothetical protein
MSLNKMAASTAYRRIGCSVNSVISSGVRHASSIEMPALAARYSGSDRPACRMNHTGVWLTGCLRQARTKTDSSGCGFTPAIVSQAPRAARDRERRNAAVTRRSRSTPCRAWHVSIELYRASSEHVGGVFNGGEEVADGRNDPALP